MILSTVTEPQSLSNSRLLFEIQDKFELKNKSKLKPQRVVLLTSLKNVEGSRFWQHECQNLGMPPVILGTSSLCAGLRHRWSWGTLALWLGSGEEEKNRHHMVAQMLNTQNTCQSPVRTCRNVWEEFERCLKFPQNVRGQNQRSSGVSSCLSFGQDGLENTNILWSVLWCQGQHLIHRSLEFLIS